MVPIISPDKNYLYTWDVISQDEIKNKNGKVKYKIIFQERDKHLSITDEIIMKFASLFGNDNSSKEPKVEVVYSDTSLAENLCGLINRCPETQKIFDDAMETNNGKEIKIEFHTAKAFEGEKGHHNSNRRYDAFTNIKNNSITIKLGGSMEGLFYCLLFELGNVSSMKQIRDLHQKVINYSIDSPDEFAKELERVEFKGEHKCILAVKNAIKANIWPEAFSTRLETYVLRHRNKPDDFDGYWEEIKDNTHANHYRTVSFKYCVSKRKPKYEIHNEFNLIPK